MSITVVTLAEGLMVRLPYSLKDSFKGVFKTAKWDPDAKGWLLGSRSKKRLEQWIEAVGPVISDIEDEAQAELNERELKVLEYDISMLRLELARQKESINSLKASKTLINQAKNELAELQRQREEERLALERETVASKIALDRVCDVDRIITCYQVMVATHNVQTSQARNRFKEAAAIIYQQHTKLLSAGFRCAGMEALGNMNVNRPDRDVPKDISVKDLLCLKRLECKNKAPS